jgi:anti-sigma factor (TIGR02949 family)
LIPVDRYTCEETFRRLDDFVDRELGADETAAVEEHLRICEACAVEFAFEESVLRQVRERVARISAPKDLLRRISARLSRETDSRAA